MKSCQLKFVNNKPFFLHHAAGHSVSPPSWCCWTCCHLFPGAGLSLYCCSCWAWDLFSWQWFSCWHLSAVLAVLIFFGCFLGSYKSSRSLLYSCPMLFFILLMILLILSPFLPTHFFCLSA